VAARGARAAAGDASDRISAQLAGRTFPGATEAIAQAMAVFWIMIPLDEFAETAIELGEGSWSGNQPMPVPLQRVRWA
jgi:hypothetical protein